MSGNDPVPKVGTAGGVHPDLGLSSSGGTGGQTSRPPGILRLSQLSVAVLDLSASQMVPEPHPAMSTSCWTRQGQWPAQAWQPARMAQLPGAHTELSTAVCMWVVIRVGKHPAGHDGWRLRLPREKVPQGQRLLPSRRVPRGRSHGRGGPTLRGWAFDSHRPCCERGGRASSSTSQRNQQAQRGSAASPHHTAVDMGGQPAALPRATRRQVSEDGCDSPLQFPPCSP